MSNTRESSPAGPKDPLLDQFRELLDAVARDIGRASVEPHLEALKRVVADSQSALTQLASEQPARQRAVETALSTFTKQASQLETMHRDGVAKIAEAAKAVEERLAPSVAASANVLSRATDAATQNVERLKSHTQEIQGLARTLDERLKKLETLRRGLADAQEQALQAHRKETERLEALVVKQFGQLRTHLDTRFDEAAKRAKSEQDKVMARFAKIEEEIARGVNQLQVDLGQRLDTTDQSLAHLQETLDSLIAHVTAPRGLAKLFHRE